MATMSPLWEGLTPPYRTIVADPPWPYPEGWPGWGNTVEERRTLPYTCMTIEEIASLNVGVLAERESYVFLWTTSRHMRAAFDVLDAWGFTYRQTVTWCKVPQGHGPGGMFASTTEFVLIGQRISPRSHARGQRTTGDRLDTSWFVWPRRSHSEKPHEFLDLVERVSPAPRVELFARAPRLGWDHWGKGYEVAV